MHIGIMLRAWDEKGGIGVYARNIVPELLRLDHENHYSLFYQNKAHIGTFSGHDNVTEKAISPANKLVWDQASIPYACRQSGVDVLFHPKFTVPFFAPCKTVMVVHGADWFMPGQAQYYHWLDVRYIRAVMPFYFKKCDLVLSVSQLTTDNFRQALSIPPDKIETVYFAPARHFRRITDTNQLQKARQKYQLPARFIFTLTKPKGDGRKNLGQIFKAYAAYHSQAENPHALVVGGRDGTRFRKLYQLPESGYGADIHFTGWIEQADMPAIYSLCSLYLYPSNLEAFPIPITEAMKCGAPIITSNVNGLKEIAGNAALLVDPTKHLEIAAAIKRLLHDEALQKQLSASGLKRAQLFSWEKCARQTLDALLRVANR